MHCSPSPPPTSPTLLRPPPLPSLPPNHTQGLTGEDAESISGSVFPGIHKHAAPHVVFATVDAQSNLDWDKHKKSTVKTRTRSAVDRPEFDGPNIGSGAPSMPALGMGNLVLAQT